MTDLVLLARARDQAAWHELVRRYAPVVWRVAAAHRLGAADRNDVSQNTWVALAEHLARLRRPDRLAGWLATTARREALRVRPPDRPVELPDLIEDPCPDHRPEQRAMRSARDRLLWRAFAALPDRCQRLLWLLAHAPDLSYAQVARSIGTKPGSIGPTRGRCLHELRRELARVGLSEETLA
ncbi:sigma-70 family RNA polymerase sigma factor [Actinophytocola sp.]|uniref:RNA polymerase sigma factor n=1 Tax=Actinophytocola sp. TaxID=1872138 RepID=UPI002D7F8C80|nr:sigma-70 family RNA polymerase sigma factor [Actinophytocola sp.]HET9141893.1 sigma-70 family RNA polymerase sigma factor [Actinophytocola sp.]